MLLEAQKLLQQYYQTFHGITWNKTPKAAKKQKEYEGKGKLKGLGLSVLNPVLCLEGKLKSVVGLPQFGRQDLKHLKMTVLIVRAYLDSLIERSPSRIGLKLVDS